MLKTFVVVVGILIAAGAALWFQGHFPTLASAPASVGALAPVAPAPAPAETPPAASVAAPSAPAVVATAPAPAPEIVHPKAIICPEGTIYNGTMCVPMRNYGSEIAYILNSLLPDFDAPFWHNRAFHVLLIVAFVAMLASFWYSPGGWRILSLPATIGLAILLWVLVIDPLLADPAGIKTLYLPDESVTAIAVTITVVLVIWILWAFPPLRTVAAIALFIGVLAWWLNHERVLTALAGPPAPVVVTSVTPTSPTWRQCFADQWLCKGKTFFVTLVPGVRSKINPWHYSNVTVEPVTDAPVCLFDDDGVAIGSADAVTTQTITGAVWSASSVGKPALTKITWN